MPHLRVSTATPGKHWGLMFATYVSELVDGHGRLAMKKHCTILACTKTILLLLKALPPGRAWLFRV